MVDRIRASFKKGFPDLTWMDDQTRKAAEDKVTSQSRFIVHSLREHLFFMALNKSLICQEKVFPMLIVSKCQF